MLVVSSVLCIAKNELLATNDGPLIEFFKFGRKPACHARLEREGEYRYTLDQKN